MIEMSIKKLVQYGRTTGLIEAEDEIYARNQIMEVLNMSEYEEPGDITDAISLEDTLNALTDYAAAHGIELVVLAGVLCVLTEKVTRAYAQRIINVHPSLIPSFCGTGYYGLKVHEAALAYGVKVTGATVHYVNEVADGGEIIAQKAVEVKPGDTPETLQRRVMEEAEWVILPAAVEQVCKILQGETI